MNARRLLFVFLALCLSLSLCACGSAAQPEASAAPEPAPESAPEPTSEPTPEPEPLDANGVLDAVFAVCPIDIINAEDLKVGPVENGTQTVSFHLGENAYSYTVDIYTGDILDKTEPEADQVVSTDPMGDAITACFNTLEGFRGDAQNIQAKYTTVDGVDVIEVTFTWNGESYDMFYDPAAGQLLP